jgi:hypothetical protein
MCAQSMDSLDRFLMCTSLVGLKISILDQDSIVVNNGKRLKNYNLKNCKIQWFKKFVGCTMIYVHVGFFSNQSKIVNVNTMGCVTLWPCHLHFKSIIRQKKNYGISNISPCKNIIFKKSSKRNQNPSRYHKSVSNLKFQYKIKYHLSKILV